MPDKSSRQANLWTEYIATPEHVEYMVFPRLLALSEAVCRRRRQDYEDFKRRLRYQLGRLDKQDVRYRIPEPMTRGLLHDDGRSHDRRSHLDGRGELDPLHARRSDPTDASPRYEAPLQIRYRWSRRRR